MVAGVIPSPTRLGDRDIDRTTTDTASENNWVERRTKDDREKNNERKRMLKRSCGDRSVAIGRSHQRETSGNIGKDSSSTKTSRTQGKGTAAAEVGGQGEEGVGKIRG